MSLWFPRDKGVTKTSDSSWIFIYDKVRHKREPYLAKESGKWVVPGTAKELESAAKSLILAGVISEVKILKKSGSKKTVGCFYLNRNSHLHTHLLMFLKSVGFSIDDIYYKLDSQTIAGIKGKPEVTVLNPHELVRKENYVGY